MRLCLKNECNAVLVELVFARIICYLCVNVYWSLSNKGFDHVNVDSHDQNLKENLFNVIYSFLGLNFFMLLEMVRGPFPDFLNSFFRWGPFQNKTSPKQVGALAEGLKCILKISRLLCECFETTNSKLPWHPLQRHNRQKQSLDVS